MGARAAGDVVVDQAWLVPRLADPEVVVADVRWYLDGRSGREAYEAGHVPGAVFVDIDGDLSEPAAATAGRHPLPAITAFAESMGSLGIGDGTTVVAYDDSGGATAARLVWMLRALGHRGALLDGGLASWQGPLETGPGRPRPRVRLTVPSEWPEGRFARADEVAAASGVTLDARVPERYRGGAPGIDPRPGHIPGARNAPWAANLGDDGRIASVDDLRAHYASLGVEPGTDVIAYCGSGVSACIDLLALEHAGLGPGRLFVASWSGWAADPARPTATGADPG